MTRTCNRMIFCALLLAVYTQAQVVMNGLELTDTTVQLSFNGQTNHAYEVETEALLTGTNWTILVSEDIVSAGGPTLSPLLPAAREGYYRLVELPFDPSVAVFVDPTNGFRAITIYDALGDTLQVDADLNALIWTETGVRYFQGAFPVIDELFLAGDKRFQIRFGSVNGQRRAYLTDRADETIYNLRVQNNALQIFSTTFTVPHT